MLDVGLLMSRSTIQHETSTIQHLTSNIPMNTIVLLFAGARELASQSETSLELPEGATVAQLREALQEKHPQLQPLLAHALFAIDNEYVDDKTPVLPDVEVACIPPVSGG